MSELDRSLLLAQQDRSAPWHAGPADPADAHPRAQSRPRHLAPHRPGHPGAFDVRAGSLFPALHRLEEKGWLSSQWGGSENNRKARYYEMTADGRKQLRAETETGTGSRSRSRAP